MTTGQRNVVKESHKRDDQGGVRNKDKEDRATQEQVTHTPIIDSLTPTYGSVMSSFSLFEVMDPRTRMILFKMINQELISEVNGCISTGKEV